MRVSGSGHSKAEGLRRERAGGSLGAEARQLELGLGDQRSGREREGAVSEAGRGWIAQGPVGCLWAAARVLGSFSKCRGGS